MSQQSSEPPAAKAWRHPPSPPLPFSLLQEMQHRLLLWLDWHEEADCAQVLDSRMLWLAAGGTVRLFSCCLAGCGSEAHSEKQQQQQPPQHWSTAFLLLKDYHKGHKWFMCIFLFKNGILACTISNKESHLLSQSLFFYFIKHWKRLISITLAPISLIE